MTPLPFNPSLAAAGHEQRFTDLLAKGDYEGCLYEIMDLANRFCLSSDFNGSALYLPGLDTLLARIAALIDAGAAPLPSPATRWGGVVVASQLETEGGHSRIVEDLCRGIATPLLIITDPYNNYADEKLNLDLFTERVPEALVVVIPRIGLFEKARELHRLCRSLDPSHIFVLTHHPDPVPFAGLTALTAKRGLNKFLIHHSDHNPALGITLDSFIHVDCTEHLRSICTEHLGRPARLLPLCVPDMGVRQRPSPQAVVSTVTSGSEGKFQREGAIAYAKIVALILSRIPGRHHHIGMLAEDWITEIRANLQSSDIDPRRFVYTGTVPSLWQQLKIIDADLYVASAPVAGGRAAIEAQGCGYPVAYFKNASQPLLFQIDEVYASRQLRWSDLDDLGRWLSLDGATLQSFSHAARAHYVAHYSDDAFRSSLDALMASG